MKISSRVLPALLGIPLAFLVLATSYSVFMRYWWQEPVHWMEETSGIAMIWLVMIGAIAAERDNDHLSIPLFVDMLNGRLRRAVTIAVSLISMGLLIYIAFLGYNLANKVAYKLTGVLKVSWYWIDIAVPVGAIGSAIYLARHVIAAWREEETSDEKQESGI